MSKGTAIIGMLISLAVGYFLGSYMGGGSGGQLAVVPAAAVPDPSVERYRIPLDKDSLVQYGQELGVDVKSAIEGNKFADSIKGEQQEAAKFGARGTPSFFINGRPLSGAQPFDAFKKVIDEELANADKAIKAGV